MAALGHATRRLLLQRTQALVVSPAVERRLVPRLLHTGGRPAFSPATSVAQNSGTRKIHNVQEELSQIMPDSSPTSSVPNADLAKILKFQEELQIKKQELYDLLAKVERDKCYMPTARVVLDRVRNVKLLQILSADVNPKPFDLKSWNFYRRTRIFNVWGVYVASLVLGSWLRDVFDRKRDDDPKGYKTARGERVKMENQGFVG